MSVPAVTVVLPCYNAAGHLGKTLDSVLAQDHPEVRLIAVDDGSTDATVAVLREYEARCAGRLTWQSGPNQGANHARNAGLALAETPYVAFLDADDAYEGPLLRCAIETAETEGADLVFSTMEIRYPDGSAKQRGPYGPPDYDNRRLVREWLSGLQLNPSATLWRTAFVRQIGGWDEAIRLNQDGEIVLRALMRGARVGANRHGRGIYRLGVPGSLSGAQRQPRKLAALLDTMDSLRAEAEATGFGDAVEGIDFVVYRIARWSFEAGEIALGRAALSRLKKGAYRRHHGSRWHRLGAALLGLERKVRLSRYFARG
ncbi:MAG: glycosyltransferase [Pseudomonadota bacterium]